MSASRSVRRRPDAGFTLVEALAALVVLALAMGQVSELIGQFVRAVRETRGAVQATTSLLADYRNADAVEGSGQSRITIGNDVFILDGATEELGKPCVFDAVGRRCR